MRDIISDISKSFIDEAISSPRMLEDLAAMEKYMSESYDGRTFVELIQNADDAGANRIKVDYISDSLIVSNDGRCFNHNDIMAICRSGASSKQRGQNIGYRGVGFKSATTISTEIVIYSAGEYFTFSKSLCSDILKVPKDKVPTVRIPFLYDDSKLDEKVITKIEDLQIDGFNTFFVFLDANMEKIKEELSGFNSGWLLFLRKINKIEINIPTKIFECKVLRKSENEDTVVKIVGSKEQWYITERNGVSLAFKYNENKEIVACDSEDAVFHCYLPTMDKTGFPFKVNADFSTDPSRKHIILDEITELLFEKIGALFIEFIMKITEKKEINKIGIIELLMTHASLGDLVSRLEVKIESKLRTEKWILKNGGKLTTPQNIQYIPKWMEKEEKGILSSNIPNIRDLLYDGHFYGGIEKMDIIVAKYGATIISTETLRNILLNIDSAKLIDPKMAAKVFAYTSRSVFTDKIKMNEMFVPTSAGYAQLSMIKSSEDMDKEFISLLMTILNVKEKAILADNYSAFKNLTKTKPILHKLQKNKEVDTLVKQMAINKWKTPVQNCLAVESLEGHKCKDVSKKCDEYSIESIDVQGIKNYIAVKQIQSPGDSFALSEKEYSAALRLGDSYKVFIIAMGGDDVCYMYISNPIQVLKLDRVVKEWKFVCNSYEMTYNKTDSNDDEKVDTRILKNLSSTYFNTNQRNFLREFLAVGIMKSNDELKDMVDKINSIADFYLGENFLNIIDGNITAEQSKINAFKKIMNVQ